MLSCPIYQVGRVLIGTHEEDLFLAVQVDNWILDAWTGWRQEKINDAVNVLFEGHINLVLVLLVEEDDTLRAAFRNVFVLSLLRASQVVVFVKERPRVDGVRLATPRLDDANTTTRDIPEAEMESAELRGDDEEHAV